MSDAGLAERGIYRNSLIVLEIFLGFKNTGVTDFGRKSLEPLFAQRLGKVGSESTLGQLDIDGRKSIFRVLINRSIVRKEGSE